MVHKDFTGVKLGIAVFGGFILDCLGGWDNELALLVWLIGVDIFSGILKAVKQKNLSSTAMREGLFKKAMIILIVALSVRGDMVIQDFFGHPIMWGDHELYLRTCFLLYFILEELLSITENASILGVPLPRWLREVLLQVDSNINETTPTQITELLKKIFGKGSDDKTEDSGNDNTLLESDDEEQSDNK